MAYQRIPIPRLRGLNEDENPGALDPGDLLAATNAVRRGNMVGTRPGAVPLAAGTDYENAITDAQAIRGAHEYRQNFDEGRRLLVVANRTTAPAGDDIFYEDASNLDLTTNTIALQADNEYAYSFATHQNNLWVTGGPPGRASVVNVDIGVWDGNVANPLTKPALTDKTTGAVLRPKFIQAWRNYLIMSGLQQTAGNRTASNNPATYRFANFGSDPTTDANWPDSNTIGFNASRVGLDTYGENFATGFATYQDNRGDFLLLLSNRQIAAVRLDPTGGNDFIVTDAISNGCVHERAYASLGLDAGDGVFVSDRGVHSVRQSQEHGAKEDKFLSWKIRQTFNSINKTRIHHTMAAYAARFGFVMFVFPSAGAGSSDLIYVLDVKDTDSLTAESALWYGPWSLGNSIKIGHIDYLRDESDEYQLFLFTTAGRVLKFDESTHTDLSTGSFSTVIRTAHASYGAIDAEKRLGDTTITLGTDVGSYNISHKAIFDMGRKSSVSLTAFVPSLSGAVIDTDLIDTATIGSTFDVFSRKLYTRGRGHTIAHELRSTGLNRSFYIGRIDQQVANAGEDTGAMVE